MLRSRSVTGWPHHLIPQISCAPAVQRDLQNHSGPGRHRGNLRCALTGMWLDKEGTCFASSLMREHYHQLPPFITPTPWVPKPKSSRRTVVNRVISECESRRNRSWRTAVTLRQKLPFAKAAVRSTLGHEEDSQSAPLGTARHPERNRGARPLFLPVAQEQSWRLLNARSQVQFLPG